MASSDTAPVRRLPIFICLGLILVYPLFSVPVQASIHTLAPRMGQIEARFVSEGAVWLYAAVVLAIALLWEGRTLASIGLRKPSWATLGFGIGGAMAMAAAGGLAAYVVYTLLHQPQNAEAQAGAMVGTSVIYALCLSVRAGVIEEILFRGLAIEQIGRLTGSRWLGAILSTALFVLVHKLHFDWIQLVPIAAVSAVLAGLYMWRRDLMANMLAHFLVDAGGLVSLALQAQKAMH